ncbi:hypothetical protein Ciccas_004757, partial [Cichlidogyrus casuarinus]
NGTVTEKTSLLRKHILTPNLRTDEEEEKLNGMEETFIPHQLFTIEEDENEITLPRCKSLILPKGQQASERPTRRAFSYANIFADESNAGKVQKPCPEVTRRNLKTYSFYYKGSVNENFIVLRSRSCSSMPELIPRRRMFNGERNSAISRSSSTGHCWPELPSCCNSSDDESSSEDDEVSVSDSSEDTAEELKIRLRKYQQKYCDFSIYNNFKFMLFILSNFITLFWFNITYFFLGLCATEQGIPESQTPSLFSIIGGFNALGQVAMGWLADRKWVNTTLLYTVSMVIAGILTCAVPLLSNLAGFIAYAILFGIFITAPDALASVLLVDYLGLRRFTGGLGICLFYQGLANIFGPPIIGKLIDKYKFGLSFVVSGAALTVSGLVLIPIILRRWYRKVKRRARYRSRQQQPQQQHAHNGLTLPISNTMPHSQQQFA